MALVKGSLERPTMPATVSMVETLDTATLEGAGTVASSAKSVAISSTATITTTIKENNLACDIRVS